MTVFKKCALVFLLTFLALQALYAQKSNSLSAVRLALLRGEETRALNLLQQVIKEQPQNAQAFYLTGMVYKETSRYNLALTFLQKAQRLNRADLQTKIVLARVYEKLGQTPQAIQTYLRVLQNDSLNLPAQSSLAAIYFKEKQIPEAVRLYDKLHKKHPNNSYFLRRLGICLFKLKKYKQASGRFLQTLKINKKDLRAYLYLGHSYQKSEQWPAALQAVSNGLQVYPQNHSLLKLNGDLLFQTKKYAQAVENYLAVVKDGRASPNLYKKLGLSYFYLNNFAPALLALKKSIQADSSDALSYYYLGLVYKKLGNYKKSSDLLESALKKMIPDYLPDVYSDLAYCYDRQKNYGEAIQAYKKALNIDSECKLNLFFIASIYDRYYKDRQSPLDYYKRFLDEAPDAPARYKDYALERVKALNEKIFFQKKR